MSSPRHRQPYAFRAHWINHVGTPHFTATASFPTTTTPTKSTHRFMEFSDASVSVCAHFFLALRWWQVNNFRTDMDSPWTSAKRKIGMTYINHTVVKQKRQQYVIIRTRRLKNEPRHQQQQQQQHHRRKKNKNKIYWMQRKQWTRQRKTEEKHSFDRKT